jgi:hypothetical protein
MDRLSASPCEIFQQNSNSHASITDVPLKLQIKRSIAKVLFFFADKNSGGDISVLS